MSDLSKEQEKEIAVAVQNALKIEGFTLPEPFECRAYSGNNSIWFTIPDLSQREDRDRLERVMVKLGAVQLDLCENSEYGAFFPSDISLTEHLNEKVSLLQKDAIDSQFDQLSSNIEAVTDPALLTYISEKITDLKAHVPANPAHQFSYDGRVDSNKKQLGG